MLSHPTKLVREFRYPVSRLIELVATIDPWRYCTAQVRHKPLSRVPKPNRRAASFFSFILSIKSQVPCKIIETIDVAGMHKQRLSRCALREDDVVPGQFYMQILDLGSLSG
jgi:hypothetical protein